jgi:hypothetical protein
MTTPIYNSPSFAGNVYFSRDTFVQQTMNEKDIQVALLRDFLEFFPTLLRNTKTAVDQLDRKLLKHFMHQLKASVALFNGVPIYTLINTLENAIENLGDREVLMRSHIILQKSEALLSEVRKFQNENK